MNESSMLVSPRPSLRDVLRVDPQVCALFTPFLYRLSIPRGINYCTGRKKTCCMAVVGASVYGGL